MTFLHLVGSVRVKFNHQLNRNPNLNLNLNPNLNNHDKPELLVRLGAQHLNENPLLLLLLPANRQHQLPDKGDQNPHKMRVSMKTLMGWAGLELH
jgi:hypothetical protein